MKSKNRTKFFPIRYLSKFSTFPSCLHLSPVSTTLCRREDKKIKGLHQIVISFWNGDRRKLIYLLGILKEIRKLKPKIIVVYDQYKLGSLLRRVIDWPHVV